MRMWNRIQLLLDHVEKSESLISLCGFNSNTSTRHLSLSCQLFHVKAGDASRLSVILLLQSFIAGDFMFILTLSTLVLKGFLASWVIPISHQAPVLCQGCLNQSRKSLYTTASSSFSPLSPDFERWFWMDLICIYIRDISSLYPGHEAEGGREREDRSLCEHGRRAGGLCFPVCKPQSPVASSQGLS